MKSIVQIEPLIAGRAFEVHEVVDLERAVY
jgi:hypothetical protein